MRSFLAGFLCLLLGLSTAARAQIDERKSFVESMGFNRAYRPDAWVPMVVNLTSTLGEPAEYLIQVVQPDIDGDRVIYERRITLNANAQEKYWVYFRPQPSGLEATSVGELQRLLKVRLCTRDGKELMLVPLTTTLADFDPKTGFNVRRGKKMVLTVIGGASNPAWLDYEASLGLIEDVEFVKVSPGDLPESVLGYDMVDTVVWFDADAAELTRAGSRKLAAMQEWVREGGQLVVCHPEETFRITPFADMLPVHLKGADDKWVAVMVDRTEPEPLHRIATAPIVKAALDPSLNVAQQRARMIADNWKDMPGPFRVARAPLKNDALVEEWVDWKPEEGGGKTPFIARNGYGLGSVTWVAQNLGDRILAGPESSGWPHVWDRVLGWKNSTVLVKISDFRKRNDIWGKEVDEWSAAQLADLGGVFLHATDHPGKAGAYVFLVILFFVGYWIVAGPGSYLFLAGKGQRHLSWAIYAVSALAATLLTVGVVKLVLRGEPEVRHVSVVRLSPGHPSIIDSRIGLYIPRDGRQRLSLKNAAADALSYITPLAVHPQHLGNPATFSDTADYAVPVRDVTGEEPVEILVPYRSTLKKLHAHWVGTMPEGIEGWAGLVAENSQRLSVPNKKDPVDAGTIDGRLVNKTGYDLKNVHFAFRFQAADETGKNYQDQEYVLYVASWKKDQALDLLRTYAAADLIVDPKRDTYVQGRAEMLRGPLNGPSGWGHYWLQDVKNNAHSTDQLVDDSDRAVKESVAVMTLFDRLAPAKNDKNFGYARAELMRRGGRGVNLSGALAAGNLVMLAEVEKAPLPLPFEVQGDRMGGEGTVFYQASIPLKNRSELMAPLLNPKAAQPATQPAAASATPPVERQADRVVQ